MIHQINENVILDPIFILLFKWNITGAAIATVVGNLVAAIFYIGYYLAGIDEVMFCDEIDCRDLFPEKDVRNRKWKD